MNESETPDKETKRDHNFGKGIYRAGKLLKAVADAPMMTHEICSLLKITRQALPRLLRPLVDSGVLMVEALPWDYSHNTRGRPGHVVSLANHHWSTKLTGSPPLTPEELLLWHEQQASYYRSFGNPTNNLVLFHETSSALIRKLLNEKENREADPA